SSCAIQACLMYFLFYEHRIPEILATSPTRRSSDLAPQHLDRGHDVRRLDVIASIGLHPDCASPAGTNYRAYHPVRPIAGRHVPGDRKSTRLNSSHVLISYAVFCLKKKNEPILVYVRYTAPHGSQRRHSLLLQARSPSA